VNVGANMRVTNGYNSADYGYGPDAYATIVQPQIR